MVGDPLPKMRSSKPDFDSGAEFEPRTAGRGLDRKPFGLADGAVRLTVTSMPSETMFRTKAGPLISSEVADFALF